MKKPNGREVGLPAPHSLSPRGQLRPGFTTIGVAFGLGILAIIGAAVALLLVLKPWNDDQLA